MGKEKEEYLTAGERSDQGIVYDACKAVSLPDEPGGLLIENFKPATIVELADGTWLTEQGQRSDNLGRSWSAPDPAFQMGYQTNGIIRLADNELGICYGDVPHWDETKEGPKNFSTLRKVALGHETNNWLFRRTADEGKTWSVPVKISLDGCTLGRQGTMIRLGSGRLVVATFSQFLPRESLWGGTYATYRGKRFCTEREGHFGAMEASRVYSSDDNGRSWLPNDGWIIGFREGSERWTDTFTEPNIVEIEDGRIFMIGRTLVGQLFSCESRDAGKSWSYARPTGLMSSYSPGRLVRLPETGDLLLIWNQLSREETRRGFRRSRLSSAISKDNGKTWTNFKNLAAIKCLADRSYIPPDPVMTPVWADEEIGEIPDDFEMWHYCRATVMGDEIFLGHSHNVLYDDGPGEEGKEYKSDSRTWIIPVQWFYE